MNKNYSEILSKYIDRKKLIMLTKDLIKIESHQGAPRFEEEVSYFIHNLLSANGIQSELQKVAEHRYNVIARIKGQNSDKALLFTGHLDTVEDYGFQALFEPYINENKIFGRGACDMKGSIASMIFAALAVKASNIIPHSDIVLAFVVDEEFKSIGTEALIKSSLKADAAILGEPTNMNISIGNRGLEWIDIEVIGRSTHGGTANMGINPISKAAKLVNRLDEVLMPKLNSRVHPVLGASLMNYGVIRSGYQPSTVPEKCVIKIDRRWTAEECIEEIYKEFQSIIDDLSLEDKEFSARLSRDLTNMNEMEHMPFLIDKNHYLVDMLKAISENVTSYQPEINIFPGWTDASLLVNYGNTPTVIFGPGDIFCAHTDREYICIDQLYNSSLIYATLAVQFKGCM